MNGRKNVPDSQVEGLVEAQVKSLLAAGKTFTAYAVTVALRTANPRMEIDHLVVRNWVEALSDEYDYTVLEIGDFNGQAARIWGKLETLLALPGVDQDQEGTLTITDEGKRKLLLPGVPSVG